METNETNVPEQATPTPLTYRAWLKANRLEDNRENYEQWVEDLFEIYLEGFADHPQAVEKLRLQSDSIVTLCSRAFVTEAEFALDNVIEYIESAAKELLPSDETPFETPIDERLLEAVEMPHPVPEVRNLASMALRLREIREQMHDLREDFDAIADWASDQEREEFNAIADSILPRKLAAPE